ENCSNIVAAIGPTADPATNILSPETHSDPLRWPDFRSNHDGDLIPPGFVRVESADGSPASAIVAREDAPGGAPAGGGAVDVDAIAEAVAARLAGGQGGGNRPPKQAQKSAEARAWEPFNTDGTPNAGSYIVGGARSTWSTAMSLLENAAYAEQDA